MSLKKNITLRLSALLDVPDLRNNKLILSTSSGIICGRIPSEEELSEENSNDNAISRLCEQEYMNLKEELQLSDNEPLPDDDGYIYLVDVQVLSGARSVNLPFMIVFYSNINGVSIGQFK